MIDVIDSLQNDEMKLTDDKKEQTRKKPSMRERVGIKQFVFRTILKQLFSISDLDADDTWKSGAKHEHYYY